MGTSFKMHSHIKLLALSVFAALSLISGDVWAQDMATFLRNLNGQMAIARGHYNAGVRIYNQVPYWQRLDYKCAMGEMRACYVRQKQLEFANNYMTRHMKTLGY